MFGVKLEFDFVSTQATGPAAGDLVRMSSRSSRAARCLVRLALSSTALLISLASCSSLPTAPISSRSGGLPGAAPSQASVAEYSSERIIARIQHDLSAQDVAASLGSHVLASIPELDIHLLAVPAGTTEGSFLRRVRSDPRIVFAEPDYVALTAESRQSSMAFSEGGGNWSQVADQDACERLGLVQAHASALGADVLVAVLDTGIELTHPALEASLDLPGIEPGVTVNPGNDRAQGVDTNGDGTVDGSLGHGTHVAGILHAVAPAARLLPVRVLDSDGVGYAFDITRGLILATERGAAVANLSLGMTSPSLAVQAAIDWARDAGVLVCAAAGNDGASAIEFPASVPAVIAVAGTDATDHKAAFSDYGWGVDLAAPSVGILSTYVGHGYAIWSGTSMATPFVSGIGALLYGSLGARSRFKLGTIEDFLLAGARPLTSVDAQYGNDLGAGRVSASGSLEAASTSKNPGSSTVQTQ
jgi:subtilisin family serine protease